MVDAQGLMKVMHIISVQGGSGATQLASGQGATQVISTVIFQRV